MTNFTKIFKTVFFVLLLGLCPSNSYGEQIIKDEVALGYEQLADGTIKVRDALNKSSRKVTIMIDGKDAGTLKAGNSSTQSIRINKIAHRIVRLAYAGATGPVLWRYKNPVPVEPKDVKETPQVAKTETGESETGETEPASVEEPKKNKSVDKSQPVLEGGFSKAMERIDRDVFFGIEAVNNYVQKTDSYAEALYQSQNKKQFLIDKDIDRFLTDSDSELSQKKGEISAIAQEAVLASKITDVSTQSAILNTLIQTLNTRYNQRETAYNKLKDAVDSVSTETESVHSSIKSIINYSIIGLIVLILLMWTIRAIRKKKKAKSKQHVPTMQQQYDSDSKNPVIVVRRRTTSMLKKQSIDDVINNPEYMLVNSSDFTLDSAVRNIYIKNTCIKDVYNLYAKDLRNSNNPKEDGCMVLGRWVFDENADVYDISLETVVLPGDDAVFKEYELNFGGKIKLRIAEKLRKLRRETNLQYDLVCWIHSHPGLGVFFSNSDNNVQMQLKHSQHPNFLIAFVVDILTTTQEMGIFTFRKDGTINSKGDLTKLYSLEDMYKWALESDKASFNPDDYHNILSSAKIQMPICKGIELNNSSIIDLAQIVIEPSTGVAGWAVGTTIETNGNKEYVVSSIVKADEKPTTGIIGVLLNVAHMSLPTIQRLIVNESSKPSFVMVYSSRQNTVTTIPVINGELITDEYYYGEETIDDLKIWTRRKR